MKALIRLQISGGRKKLVTMSKLGDIPEGIYSEKSVRSVIDITPDSRISARLKVENVYIHENNSSVLVSDNTLQATDHESTSSLERLKVFISAAENSGWSVEKYVDGINAYFGTEDAAKIKTSATLAVLAAKFSCCRKALTKDQG
jgi:hypothetical protein